MVRYVGIRLVTEIAVEERDVTRSLKENRLSNCVVGTNSPCPDENNRLARCTSRSGWTRRPRRAGRSRRSGSSSCACGSGRSRWTYRSSQANWPLRADRASSPSCSSRSRRPGKTNRSLCTRRTSCTVGPSCSSRASQANRSLRACRPCSSGYARRSLLRDQRPMNSAIRVRLVTSVSV